MHVPFTSLLMTLIRLCFRLRNQLITCKRYPRRKATLCYSSQVGVRDRTEQNGDQKQMPESISKITVLVRRCICWSLGSLDADDMKNAVLRRNYPASLFCFWSLHLHGKKSPVMLYKNAFPLLFNLCKDRVGIREKLIKCNRL